MNYSIELIIRFVSWNSSTYIVQGSKKCLMPLIVALLQTQGFFEYSLLDSGELGSIIFMKRLGIFSFQSC